MSGFILLQGGQKARMNREADRALNSDRRDSSTSLLQVSMFLVFYPFLYNTPPHATTHLRSTPLRRPSSSILRLFQSSFSQGSEICLAGA